MVTTLTARKTPEVTKLSLDNPVIPCYTPPVEKCP
jgi:hypothetical protein